MSNLRAILWLLLGIAVLAGANAMLALDGSQRTDLVIPKALIAVPDGSVSMLKIERAGAPEAVLTRTGSWRLVAPFAGSVDETVVLRLLDALAYAKVTETLGDQELLKLGRTRADFGLAPPRLEVSVRAGAEVSSVGFGSLTPAGDGVYAAVGGVNAVFIVPSNTLAAVDVPTEGFRRRSLFTLGADEVAAFDVKCGAEEFLRFRREGEAWFLTQPAASPASAVKVRKLLADVTGAAAADFVWPVGGSNEVAEASAALLAGYGLDAESAVTVTLKGHDGVDRSISFGSEAKDGLVYALVHNGTAVVTVDRALKDQASLGNAAFADTRLFPYQPTQVTGVSLTDGGVSCLLAKAADGTWRMDSPVSAPASVSAVEALVSSVLALRGGDLDDAGVAVSLSAEGKPVKVSRRALGVNFRLEDLRSLEILRLDPATVRRLTVSGPGGEKSASVVYDRDRRAWNVESAKVSGTVSERGVRRVLGALSPLTASRIVKLKVKADDLSAYGLDAPRLTVSADLAREDSIRRNVLVGDATAGGAFATVGASDAVFVLPESAVENLSAALVEE